MPKTKSKDIKAHAKGKRLTHRRRYSEQLASSQSEKREYRRTCSEEKFDNRTVKLTTTKAWDV